MYIHRSLEKALKESLEQFPVVLVTGPRQAGKSTFLQHGLKEYNYVTFDDILARNLAESDPILFLKTYAALQNLPIHNQRSSMSRFLVRATTPPI